MSNYNAGSFILDEISSQGSAWSEIIPLILHQREAIRELFRGIDGVDLQRMRGSGLKSPRHGTPSSRY